jgi:uncharacterized protein YukE
MDALQVTTSELSGLSGRLSRLLSGLDQAATRMQNTNTGAAGAPQLESSISAFLADWSSGLEQVRSALSTLASRLDGAADGYQRTESAVVDEFAGR